MASERSRIGSGGWGISSAHNPAINRSETRRFGGPLAGTIVDRQLVLDEDGLGNDRAHTSGTDYAENGGNEMNEENSQVAHATW